jgi:hypothetical protein
MAEERSAALRAYAQRLVDAGAAKTWLGKTDGAARISARDDGRFQVNGAKDRYIFCPYQDEVFGSEDRRGWQCGPTNNQIATASLIPFGLDPVLRRMTAKINLLTRDDRPAGGYLVRRRQ